MIIKIMILPFKPEKITIRIVGLSVITFKFETRRAKRTFEAEEIYVCYADETDIVSDERMAASLSWPTL